VASQVAMPCTSYVEPTAVSTSETPSQAHTHIVMIAGPHLFGVEMAAESSHMDPPLYTLPSR
jgi:hypothetical protein